MVKTGKPAQSIPRRVFFRTLAVGALLVAIAYGFIYPFANNWEIAYQLLTTFVVGLFVLPIAMLLLAVLIVGVYAQTIYLRRLVKSKHSSKQQDSTATTQHQQLLALGYTQLRDDTGFSTLQLPDGYTHVEPTYILSRQNMSSSPVWYIFPTYTIVRYNMDKPTMPSFAVDSLLNTLGSGADHPGQVVLDLGADFGTYTRIRCDQKLTHDVLQIMDPKTMLLWLQYGTDFDATVSGNQIDFCFAHSNMHVPVREIHDNSRKLVERLLQRADKKTTNPINMVFAARNESKIVTKTLDLWFQKGLKAAGMLFLAFIATAIIPADQTVLLTVVVLLIGVFFATSVLVIIVLNLLTITYFGSSIIVWLLVKLRTQNLTRRYMKYNLNDE